LWQTKKDCQESRQDHADRELLPTTRKIMGCLGIAEKEGIVELVGTEFSAK